MLLIARLELQLGRDHRLENDLVNLVLDLFDAALDVELLETGPDGLERPLMGHTVVPVYLVLLSQLVDGIVGQMHVLILNVLGGGRLERLGGESGHSVLVSVDD